jgi:uncharacterized protein (TIGR02145 family)
MTIIKLLIRSMLFTFCLILFSCSGSYKDQDGNSFKTVQIGDQLWMAENLNVTHFRNGDEIPTGKSSSDWQREGEAGNPMWCNQGNDPGLSKKYGRLYNWFAVNDPRGLAPRGWHVASDAEWKNLTDFYGGEVSAALKIRTTGSPGEAGFGGLPGGGCKENGTFYGYGTTGLWWTSSEVNTIYGWMRLLNYKYCNIFSLDENKLYGLSVRCIKD